MDTIKTYKPKQSNIEKLKVYLSTLKPKENGK